MTIKRLILIALTIVALYFTGVSLYESLEQPQIQSRLELYQTDILLNAAQWQPAVSQEASVSAARNTIVGDKPLEAATQQYQEARESAQVNLEKAKSQLAKAKSQPVAVPVPPKPQTRFSPVPETSRPQQQQQLQQSINQLEKLTAELDLRIGILQAQQGQTAQAIKTWTGLEHSTSAENQVSLVETATVLTGLWSNPARLLPSAQELIQKNLDGWFRYQALARLYELQQRSDALESLQAAEQKVAEQALLKLVTISSIPTLGSLFGVGLLIFLVSQRLLQGKQSLLAQNGDVAWVTPWNGETVWQVFIFGFFLIGQILTPLFLLQLKPAGADMRTQAFYILVSYLFLALGTFGVLYLSVKPFFPLPEGWFRFDWRGSWLLWGLGGYCVALPLVIAVSLLNQQIWQGEGGSNPLLPLTLESQDQVARVIFFLTAAVAAPLFEEFLFRGFLLPSLTRYLPVRGAIVTSALLFAIAHLSLSEILPLTVLGIVLGVVYTRSRNLLSSMLIHSLWNSGTLLSLFVLGSGSS
ncbi:MAG: CPBP family intramembrane metalloprotease [Chroococcidiopsidaceae cyanobacterium CP_BM_ER_R8_30]|nr:CPBP family intramembrane metalloprotease [Chroococcidiopsidaceae cyanobacterium CP_BM_ER_R8_30]